MDKDRSRSGKTGPGRAWFKVQFVQTTLGQKSRLKKFFFNVFKIPYFFHFPNTNFYCLYMEKTSPKLESNNS